jgi:hypothetical protein
MTVAICYKCGEFKFGAFTPCAKCGAMPQNEDDLALSLAMTDHYFDEPTLKQMGAKVKDGTPPRLDPETHANFVREIRGLSGLLERVQKPPPVRKPWWKFW